MGRESRVRRRRGVEGLVEVIKVFKVVSRGFVFCELEIVVIFVF